MDYDYRWLAQPQIFAVRRMDAHSDHAFSSAPGLDDFRLSLNGSWELSAFDDPEQEGVNAFCFEGAAPQRTVSVPGHLQLQGVGTPQYTNVQYPWDGKLSAEIGGAIDDRRVACYRKSFTLPPAFADKRVSVVLHGADCAAYVFCNGSFAGYGEDSATPSEFDLTELVRREGENTLVVQLFFRSTASWLEDQDFWRLSGLYRGVELLARPACHVEDVFLHPDLSDDYRQAALSVDFRCTGELAGYALSARLLSPSGEAVGSATACSWDGRMNISFADPLLWSGEFPNLYTVEITVVREPDGKAVEFCVLKTGFRKIELLHGAYHINGHKLQLRGVNRHEFCARFGRAVPESVMKEDIFLLKRHNVNAVRTSHYPNQSAWYRLCDEYGIYLIDEANLETHGSWAQADGLSPQTNLPGNREEFLGAVVDRAKSMVERDKNHPSVVVWSLGNESFAGTVLEACAQFVASRDPSRPIHYEGVSLYPDYARISAFESHMYAHAADVRAYLENAPAKPYLLCEYAHAMHNSCGGLEEYRLLEQYPAYQGGFIWDFADQCLLDENGNYAYGGDFGDRPTDYDFCCNGMFFADRTPSPKAQEVKQVYAPVRITVARSRVGVENRKIVGDLSDLLLVCTAWDEGRQVFCLEYPLSAKPGETEIIPNLFPEPGERDLVYRAEAVLKEDTPWAKAGYSVAFGDKRAEGSAHPIFDHSGTLEIFEGGWNVGARWNGGSVLFSLADGGMVSLTRGGKELISRAPRPCYWRASTSNDFGCSFPFESGVWATADLLGKPVDHSYEIDPERHFLTVRIRFGAPAIPRLDVCVSYTVNAAGEILVTAQYNGISGLPLLPEFGLHLFLDKSLSRLSYYGRGPEENYRDRRSGAALGWYQTCVQACLTPYLRPQECGNRTDVRALTLTDENGAGLYVAAMGDDPMEFSCLPVDTFALQNARHLCDLPAQSETHLKLLAVQMGVGGDDSWGAPVLPQHRIFSGQDYCLRVILKTV